MTNAVQTLGPAWDPLEMKGLRASWNDLNTSTIEK
jgi:hypothetical protein